MRTQVAFVILFSSLASAQARRPVPFDQLDEIRAVNCKAPVPDGFGCGILFDVDLPDSNNMIRSMVGGTIGHVSVALDGTLYTVSYDPPLKRDNKFLEIGRKTRIPARVEGNTFIIRWPDGTEAKGEITRREKINPDRPQPA